MSGPNCPHLDAEPVESVIDSEVLAHLCQSCGEQLPDELPPMSPALVVANRMAAMRPHPPD